MSEDGYKEVRLAPKKIKIPNGWEVNTVESFSKKVTDGTHATPNYTENGVPFLSTKNLKPFTDDFDLSDYVKHISQEDHEELIKRAHPEKGDILISKSGTIGRTQKIRTDLKFSIFVGLALIKPEYDRVCSDYLEQLFNADFMQSILDIKSPGSTRKTLNVGTLKKQKVVLPPLSEQRRIANILSKTDEQIEQTDEIIEKTKELKRGLIQDLIFFGKSHNGTQTVQLGPMTTEVAESWDVTTVDEVTTKVQYGSSESLSTEGEYPIFRMNNIEDGKMVSTPMKYTDLEADQAEKYQVEKGDILFNRTNSIDLVGKSGIFDLDGEYVFASYLIRLRTNEKINPYFLNFYLNSHIGQGILFSIATRGASQANINATNLKGVKVPLPPRDQQDRIVERIQKVEKKIKKERKTKQYLQGLKRGLMQDLLTGTVRASTEN